MAYLLIAKTKKNMYEDIDKIKEYHDIAEKFANNCEDKKQKFLGWLDKQQKEITNIECAMNRKLNADGLNKIDVNTISLDSTLECNLKLVYNYGFFFTYIREGEYTDGLLHKNTFGEKQEYLLYILRRIKPIDSVFTVKVINFYHGKNGKSLVFAPSENFEKEVLQTLDDYVLKDKSCTILDLSNLKLEFLPISIQILKKLETLIITGNPLPKLNSYFFDKMPNLTKIIYGADQNELVEKLKKYSKNPIEYQLYQKSANRKN